MEEAIRLTKRPRHMEAALYHLRRARREGTPIPPGCQLTLIAGRPRLMSLISVLRLKDLWSQGVVPPLTPREEAAMRVPEQQEPPCLVRAAHAGGRDRLKDCRKSDRQASENLQEGERAGVRR